MKNIITQNSKLKETSKKLGLRVFNFGITAYKTKSGKLTCPFADKCVKFCYAKKGAYIWSNVAKVFEQRYQLTKSENFINIMKQEIIKKRVDFLRVHDSGDFYSNKYFLDWMQIAKSLPNVKFYAYTNSIQIVKNNKNNIPENFDFIFSDSGKQVNLINKNKDRHTKIFKTENELLEAGYINASKIDLNATKFINPKNKKVGLVYH
jgi:hypothetical protein